MNMDHGNTEAIVSDRAGGFGARTLKTGAWVFRSFALAVRAFVIRVLLALITIYQRWVSPFVGPSCRYTPTCSAYAAASLRKYGVIKGLLRSSWRVLRCHPFCRGGHDPP